MNIIEETISTEATRRNVRLMIPVMVHWAKTGHNEHSYGDLIHAIGKSHFSGIGHALYAVQEVLNALSKQSGKKIPTLNLFARTPRQCCLPKDLNSSVLNTTNWMKTESVNL